MIRSEHSLTERLGAPAPAPTAEDAQAVRTAIITQFPKGRDAHVRAELESMILGEVTEPASAPIPLHRAAQLPQAQAAA
ncbi:hypothetical protein BKA24_001740 [Microbacterium marinum]|uniref:Uncharacterized protein n=1 Tax=Microbacterium marinum TaxID=421115 RepID=A0A7W7BQL5_9MICO|nr:hypothetical protein [Microbacterium marinum]MBB4667031.1 hypothetical protein [Microbacterium marinum]